MSSTWGCQVPTGAWRARITTDIHITEISCAEENGCVGRWNPWDYTSLNFFPSSNPISPDATLQFWKNFPIQSWQLCPTLQILKILFLASIVIHNKL